MAKRTLKMRENGRLKQILNEVDEVCNGNESVSSDLDKTEERLDSVEDEKNTSLKIKCVNCERLKKLLSDVDNEVHELTEKVFQEAYKMVDCAQEHREKAEKLEIESRLKVDVLQAEVEALKSIVKSPKRSLAQRILHGSPIHNPNGSIFSRRSYSPFLTPPTKDATFAIIQDKREVDPIAHREFVDFMNLLNAYGLSEDSAFMRRAIQEDIMPCLVFENSALAKSILDAIQKNTLEMEPLNDDKSTLRECALTKVTKYCPYRVRLNAETDWSFISLLARNRIAAICDFFTYLTYLHKGIVKTGIHDSYWEIVNLKKNLMFARLGLEFYPKTYNQENGD